MGSVFKEIDKSFTLTKDETRLNALRQINNYIKTGNWDKKKNSERVLSVLGLKQSEACERLGLTEGGYKVMMKRASDKIKSIIGENTIHDIVYGDVDKFNSAMIQFNIGVKQLLPDIYITTDVYKEIPRGYEREYNLGDLDAEISFLKQYTKGYILKELSNMDSDKLAYIISVLSDNSGRMSELRSELFKQIVMSNPYNKILLQKI